MKKPLSTFLLLKLVQRGSDNMSSKKGISHKQYSCEEKLRVVLEVVQNHKSSVQVSKEEGIEGGTIRRWVRQYNKIGIEALEDRRCNRGNRFSALHSSKSLSDIDRLELTVEKLRVENERLKKGYIVKGVGAAKEFVTLKDLNSK